MGFVNHGGMWGDLVLLPMANAVIVPHLTAGGWIAGATALSTVASLAVHKFWYRPFSGPLTQPTQAEAADVVRRDDDPSGVPGEGAGGEGDHMWPSYARGTWAGDLSWSGWGHVAYVAGELTLLCGFLLHSIPPDVVIFVAAIFTVHIPIGLLQPRWYRTGHIATVSEQPLLAPLLLALWTMAAVKL